MRRHTMNLYNGGMGITWNDFKIIVDEMIARDEKDGSILIDFIDVFQPIIGDDYSLIKIDADTEFGLVVHNYKEDK